MMTQKKSLFLMALLVLSALLTGVWITLHTRPQIAAPQPSAAPAAPARSDARTLRLGLNIAADSALHAAAQRFAEQVAERSRGKLQIKVFPDQQLGSDDQMLEMARNGKLDLLLIPTAKISSAIPAMQYADLPFYFSGRDELYAMLDGEPGQMLLSKLHGIDLVGLAFWENGFKQFTANTPIQAPQDFARLRIRTMKSPLIADQFSSLGAQPIPIDFHATYQALAEGAVDGQENPLVAIHGMRLHEVQKHLTLSNHAWLGYVFTASRAAFETLSPEARATIENTARELTRWEREETARREAGFIEKIKAAGVVIHELSPESRQQFSAAMAPIADKFGFEVGYDLLGKTEELRYLRRLDEGTADTLLIGLNADLTGNGAQAGGAIYRGMQLAVEEINRQGGLLGKPVQILARDHSANPQIGRNNLTWFSEQSNLLALVGGLHSSVITDELADIHRLKLPYLIPWAAARDLTHHSFSPSYTFRVSLSDEHVAPFLLERAVKLGGRVDILLERSAWGRSNEAELIPLVQKLPPGSAHLHWFDAGDPRLTATVTQLIKDGSRSIVMVANPMEARTIVKAMAQTDKPVPIFSHWGLVGGDFFGAMQTTLQKVDLRFVQSILVDDGGRHPHLGKFLSHYRQRYGLNAEQAIPSLIGSVHAYDLTHLLARAVRQARSKDREALRHALENLPRYSGVLQDYTPPFSRDRHDALDPKLLHLARFDEQGRIVLAE